MRTIGYDDDDDDEDDEDDDDDGENENDKQGTLLHLLCCLPRKHSPSSSGSLDCICIPTIITIIMMMLVMMMIKLMQAILWVSVSILLICSLETGCLPLIKGGKFCNMSFIRLQIGTRMYHNYLEKAR